MTTDVRPTLLLIHGAWERAAMWQDTIRHLPSDVEVRNLQLPSSAAVPAAELGDLYADAAAIRGAADAIGRPTVAVGHSYGGAPMSEGLVGAGNVRRLVYLAGFQLDAGESMLSVVGERPYFWGLDHLDEGYYEMTDPVNVFYPDLEPEIAAEAIKGLVPQSVTSLHQTLTQAAWRTIDSTYILTEKEALPAFFEPFAKRADRIRPIATAHAPFISQPRELAKMLVRELDEAGSV